MATTDAVRHLLKNKDQKASLSMFYTTGLLKEFLLQEGVIGKEPQTNLLEDRDSSSEASEKVTHMTYQ